MQLADTKEEEIKVDEWRNVVARIIPFDLEAIDNLNIVSLKLAHSQMEIEQEEKSIKAWKEGKIA